ncbi:MAG: hypothetical protein U9R19_15330, partial [Bacteroidota bacterium]|nr:hypothetical protein [Bacteroidota bacterium]
MKQFTRTIFSFFLTFFVLMLMSDFVQAQSPILIINLDGNANSGPVIETAIVNNGLSADYVTSFPTSLSGYSTIFVCLGVYNNNVALSATEGSDLASFVNAGGSIYMEGGDTWAYDPATLVHPLFNINGLDDGSNDLSFIVGQAGTLSEGISFNYYGDNSYIDQIEPISPAVALFGNTPTFYDCAVIHEAAAYKTIGASFEFGGLEDDTISGSTKNLLMEKYLQFFDLLAYN